MRLILFIALGFLGFVICLASILYIYDRHSRQRSKEEEELVDYYDRQHCIRNFRERAVPVVNTDVEVREALYSNHEVDFRIVDILNATENLHDQYIIGQGGHGIVYKAELDFGAFAVKKVKFGQSNRKKLNMIKEIEMTRKIRHQNVARCLGSWIGEDYGLTISKYKENGSLHDVLHEHNPQPSLAWNVRYKIAIGVAKGLAYLHHDCDPPILHRDIKPKNVLLDSDMQPCITDFGISIALNQSSARVNMQSTYIQGTTGFMAPEVAFAIAPCSELDVFSYGVVLLELITRKKVLDSSFSVQQTTLVQWFKSVWRTAREIEKIVDSSIAGELSDLNVRVQVLKVILVALICTQKDPRKRLKMLDVVEFFETPTDPGIFVCHGGNPFNLGDFLATVGASYLFQDDKILAKGSLYSVPFNEMLEDAAYRNNLNMISRRTCGVVSKVQLQSGRVCAERKVTFAGNKDNILSVVREIKMLEMIRHRNIVRMLRYSFPEDYGIICYDEYLSNGNLHDLLYEKNPAPSLKWNVRYKIATGIARGLAYLHHDCDPPIMHGAIRPRNILLDSDMEPRIADFGFAEVLCHPSTPAACRSESDVYSYGIVLLQLITRKNATDGPSFMEGIETGIWMRSTWRETGAISKIVDAGLAEEVVNPFVHEQIIDVLLVALKCSEMRPFMRPTMRDVVNQLKDP